MATRTITLTDRRPVSIDDAAWPIIAKASGDTFAGSDYARHQQARARGEIDEYSIRVRQHADGRAVVYAIVSAAAAAWHQPAGGIDHRGGVLLDSGADIAAAIRAVGEAAGIPAHTIAECIADLPAESI